MIPWIPWAQSVWGSLTRSNCQWQRTQWLSRWLRNPRWVLLSTNIGLMNIRIHDRQHLPWRGRMKWTWTSSKRRQERRFRKTRRATKRRCLESIYSDLSCLPQMLCTPTLWCGPTQCCQPTILSRSWCGCMIPRSRADEWSAQLPDWILSILRLVESSDKGSPSWSSPHHSCDAPCICRSSLKHEIGGKYEENDNWTYWIISWETQQWKWSQQEQQRLPLWTE